MFYPSSILKLINMELSMLNWNWSILSVTDNLFFMDFYVNYQLPLQYIKSSTLADRAWTLSFDFQGLCEFTRGQIIIKSHLNPIKS